MKKNWTVFLPKLGMIVLGNLLYALAVTLFIVPNQLLTGGTTGLALFFYRTAGIPVSVFVCVFRQCSTPVCSSAQESASSCGPVPPLEAWTFRP